MMKIAMSPAAAAMLRALIAHARVDRNRILLTDVESIDWRSLTFTGERHQISVRVTGSDSEDVVQRMCAGLADAEFSIPGIIVADIGVLGLLERKAGCTDVVIEALTISED